MTELPSRLASALSRSYRLERELGQGGMATVYLAHDLKHDRPVAIKVLRPELAAVIGAERFLAEIKTTANLQHPHILPLFDSGATALGRPERSEGPGSIGSEFLFYVMPYVEGESLRDRLSREKQLPIPDAVRIATEIASALDYAHRKGIVHRDIKPENILLHDGRALVADFGIALAASKAGGARLTETGMSLGTPAYMSPEQAMGERDIGPRSDVYALGCVLYEMLVGEPPFTGPTAQAIVSKVMTAAPPRPSEGRSKVPPAVEAAVLTALEKLPADRFATCAEFAAALADKVTPRQERSEPIGRAASRPLARLGPLTVAALALIATAFLGGRRLGRSEVPTLPPARLSLLAPALGAPNTSTAGRQLALTPTGDAVVYVGTRDSSTALFLQRLDQPGPVEIVGSAGLRDPTITLDGRSVLGLSPTGGFRLPLEGGTPRAVALPSTSFIGTWGPDGSYWFTSVDVGGLVRLTPTDSAVPLDPSMENQRGLRIQQVLEDGHSVLVVRASSATASGPGMVFDLRTGELTQLLEGPILEMRSARGELLCALPDGSLTAAPFDERKHRILGPAVQFATGMSVTGNGIAQFAVAKNGTLAYVQAGPASLVLVDRSGAAEVAVADQPFLHAPHFSPDGRRVSFDITTAEGRDVWIYARDARSRTRATFDKDGHDATWTPDGRFITYTSFLRNANRLAGIYRVRPGSTAPPESLFVSAQLSFTGTWLGDQSALITDANGLRGQSGGDIARIANGGRGPLEPLLASPFLERFAVPSPDGRLLAFSSNQSGREEIYVQPLTGEEGVQVSRDGGSEPVWAPDGGELFYRGWSGDRIVLFAATLRATPDLAVTGQRELFPIPDIVGSGPHANYDISPDGRTFAMSRQNPSRHIVVIQDLPALLRRVRSATSVSR